MAPFKTFFLTLSGAALAVVLVGLALPSRVVVERSTLIEAPRPLVFAVLEGLHRFREWSPWPMGKDAVIERHGPVTGAGALLRWDSGAGVSELEIIDSEPHASIRARLRTAADRDAELTFSLQEEGKSTLLHWRYAADVGGNLLGRYLGLLGDEAIGRGFERGLQQLKSIAEGLPAEDLAAIEAEPVQVAGLTLAYVAGRTGTDPMSIGTAYAVSLSRLLTMLRQYDLSMRGKPLLVVRERDEATDLFAYEVAIPVVAPSKPLPEDAELRLRESYAGVALRAVHVGTDADLPRTHRALRAHALLQGFEVNGDPWEAGRAPGAAGRVTVYLPVRR